MRQDTRVLLGLNYETVVRTLFAQRVYLQLD